MLYYISENKDPAFNIATEYYLFHHYDEPIFYLWINSPTIVVGKHQNTIEEINAAYVKEKNIRVCRRVSGGGAVYHDEGNLNYTIIDNLAREQINFKRFSHPVTKALEQMGVEAASSGRNDITVDGFKICGNAQYINKGRVMHHGCILFDVDLGVLGSALQVPADKIKSKGVKSVRARVKNIVEFLDKEKGYTIEDFMALITANIKKEYEAFEPLTLDDAAIEDIQRLRDEKFIQWDWVYGKSPEYNMKRKRKLSKGNYEVRLNVLDGLIKDIRFYGDFFGIGDVADVEKGLIGIKYEEDAMRNVLTMLDVEKIFSATPEEVLALAID